MTDYDRVEKAIQYLEAHFKDQPNLETIAAQVHLSPYHFDRLFKRWAGVTPKQFLHFLTLNYAKETLRHSRSVLDAAYDAGLSSGSRLHDLFVKIEGVTPGEYRQMGAGVDMRYGFQATAFGSCFLAVTDRGITSLSFNIPGEEKRVLTDLRKIWPKAALRRDDTHIGKIVDAVMLPDQTTEKQPVPVFVKGTAFQLQVWRALVQIPPGNLFSYEDLARWIGRPEATRAVSTAVARNPVGYLIPCHRVIRKSGIIGKYHWGSERKKALIGWEASRQIQLETSI